MPSLFRPFLLLLALAVAACAPRPASVAAPMQRPPVILISVDGLRADYLRRGVSPNLAALAGGGVTTPGMRPSFPSLTFPNHYTLVTGLRPDRHGIVNNNMEDTALGSFSLSNRAAVENGRWWDAAEPVWVTAEKAGLRTATMFWPGSEAAIRGVRPSRWLPFDGKMPNTARVDQLLAWLDETPRPAFATLYFDTVDHDGHEFGPDAPETTAALAEVDGQIGRLLAGLKARGIAANIVLVADHGMAPVAPERAVFLDEVLPPASYRLVSGGAVAGIVPAAGQDEAVARTLLGRHGHYQCWRKADIPARLHYGRNPRVPPILCLADANWVIFKVRPPTPMTLRGMHGHDPADPQMDAAFIANGPAFRAGVVLPPFDNVDVQPLLLRLLGLKPLAVDGSIRSLEPALR